MSKKKKRKRISHLSMGEVRNKFKTRYIKIARIACEELGADEKRLGMLCGEVSDRTIRRWIRKYPKFGEAVNKGRELFDSMKIERSMVHRATGFEYDEVSEEEIFLKNRSDKGKVSVPAIKRKTTRKLYPGEPSCMFFWLINRSRNRDGSRRWMNIHQIQHSGELNTNSSLRDTVKSLSSLSTEELEQMNELYKKMEATAENS